MARRSALLLGAAAHGALLVGPALLLGRLTPWGAAAAGVFALASVLEGSVASSSRSVGPPPMGEVARGLALLVALWVAVATPGGLVGTAPLGFACVLGGLGLRVWAARSLGEGFGPGLAPTVAWVSDGPYRWLRHPSEVGLLGSALGVALVAGSSLGALVWVGLVAVPGVARTVLEDRAVRVPGAAAATTP
ncbi:MAG: methyltransferase [Myxococcota bacterium]